jgi:hypothetical protein
MSKSSKCEIWWGLNRVSAGGDRQVAQLAKYQQQWEKLEGREPQRQQEQAKAQKIERGNSPGMSR